MALPDVEAAFAKRLGDMTAFDAFMDHHVSLWAPRRGVPRFKNITPRRRYTDDLLMYTAPFDADGVPYYLMSWESGRDTWCPAARKSPRPRTRALFARRGRAR